MLQLYHLFQEINIYIQYKRSNVGPGPSLKFEPPYKLRINREYGIPNVITNNDIINTQRSK